MSSAGKPDGDDLGADLDSDGRVRSPADSILMIAAESSSKYRTRPPARPPRRTLRNLKAYATTFRVIASYLWLRFMARFRSEEWATHKLDEVHGRNARRIERAICELQGLFIKVGQLISIMTNFLPPAFRRELEGLQDAVPPRPYADIEARLREELGDSPQKLFAHFEENPIASASIGQVHLARLLTGEKVAVKVQYPDIEEIVKTDLKTLRRIFRILEYFVPYNGMEDLYREIRTIVIAELDYRAEAEQGARVASHFEGRTDVAFPRVVAHRSTSRVLTTHFEPGCKISDSASLKRMNIDRATLARQVVEIYCQQIFTDGVYHADPHPGNLLVRVGEAAPRPTVVFLDFGAVAEIPAAVRQGIIELIQGALTRDTKRIVTAMRTMGFVARGADDGVFEQVIEYFHSRFQETISLESLNLKDIKFDPQKSLESLADLQRMDVSLRELSRNFHVPKELIILNRTLLLLMGLCTELDPKLNPMTVLGDGDWSGILVETSKDLVMSVTSLPADLRKFMKSAHTGDLQLRIGNLVPSTKLMYRLGHQVMFTAVGIAGAAVAVVFDGRGDFRRAAWGWWTAGVTGALLVWSLWSSRDLLRRRQ